MTKLTSPDQIDPDWIKKVRGAPKSQEEHRKEKDKRFEAMRKEQEAYRKAEEKK